MSSKRKITTEPEIKASQSKKAKRKQSLEGKAVQDAVFKLPEFNRPKLDPSTKLAYGSWSCIFYPPLECKEPSNALKTSTEQLVMKYGTAKAIQNELRVRNKIIQGWPFCFEATELFLLPLDRQEYFCHDSDQQRAMFQESERRNCRVISDATTNEDHHKGLDYYYTELAGPTLDTFLMTRPRPLDFNLQVFLIMYRIFVACFVLYILDISHNDLNATNVLFDFDGLPKIIDFGHASDLKNSFTTDISFALDIKSYDQNQLKPLLTSNDITFLDTIRRDTSQCVRAGQDCIVLFVKGLQWFERHLKNLHLQEYLLDLTCRK